MTLMEVEKYIIKPIRDGSKTTYGKKELIEFIYQCLIKYVMDCLEKENNNKGGEK